MTERQTMIAKLLQFLYTCSLNTMYMLTVIRISNIALKVMSSGTRAGNSSLGGFIDSAFY